MKKILLITVFASVLMFVGCNVSSSISSAVEKSYTVIVKGIDAVDYISEKVAGSELGNEIGDDLASVRNALSGLQSTLILIGNYVGAEMPVTFTLSQDPISGLDVATEDLIRSIEKME